LDFSCGLPNRGPSAANTCSLREMCSWIASDYAGMLAIGLQRDF
jgi:hypothetical protein